MKTIDYYLNLPYKLEVVEDSSSTSEESYFKSDEEFELDENY